MGGGVGEEEEQEEQELEEEWRMGSLRSQTAAGVAGDAAALCAPRPQRAGAGWPPIVSGCGQRGDDRSSTPFGRPLSFGFVIVLRIGWCDVLMDFFVASYVLCCNDVWLEARCK